MRHHFRLIVLLAASMLTLSFMAPPDIARAVDSPTPETKPAPKPAAKPATKSEKKKKAPKKDQKSEQQFIDGYKAAHATIYQRHDYAAGIAQLHALRRDDHSDVANLLGYSSRKLGKYDDAKYWYEKALAANPNHTLTWSYYGMWYAEQGNFLKARDHLAKIAALCGTQCREYVMLKEVIEGTRVY